MKKAVLTIIVIVEFSILIVGFNGCSPNECGNYMCENGGECLNEVCDCPDGYIGSSCETEDPCNDIVCLNDGVCLDGSCACADGYSGGDCSTEVSPQTILITQIDVLNMPTGPGGGEGWDDWIGDGGPDLFVEVRYNSTTIYTSERIDDAGPLNNYTFTPSSPISLTAPTEMYSIRLMDADGGGVNQIMGVVDFVPYQNNGFPSGMTVSSVNGANEIALYFDYEW
jgi:hypothetical protein